jgi:hypothetical protein
MAKHPTILQIPKACPEKWDGMKPAAQGRFCASCQEPVMDFTRMSDTEILAFMQAYPAISCGRFSAGQLNRPLWQAQPFAVSPWRRWLATLVAVWGLGQLSPTNAFAQNECLDPGGGPPVPLRGQTAAADRVTADQQPGAAAPGNTASRLNERPSLDSLAASTPSNTLPAEQADSVRLSGVVLNRIGRPIKGATVRVSTMGTAAETDEDGYFELVVPAWAATVKNTSIWAHKRHFRGTSQVLADVAPEQIQLVVKRTYFRKWIRRWRMRNVRSGKFR